MRNAMKATWTLALLGAAGLAQAANAAVVDGYYKGEDSKAPKAVIKTVQQNGVASSYALILWSDTQTSLFRIEEVDTTTQAWVQIFQSSDYILASDVSQEATFAVQTSKDGKGKAILSLAPTDFGKSIGCGNLFKLTQDANNSWSSLGEVTGTFNTGSDVAGTLVTGGKTNEFALQGEATLENKTFAATELFPGLAVLRAQTLDPESIDGRSLERNISFVALSLERTKGGFFGSTPYTELRLIQLTAGTRSCASATLSLTR